MDRKLLPAGRVLVKDGASYVGLACRPVE